MGEKQFLFFFVPLFNYLVHVSVSIGAMCTSRFSLQDGKTFVVKDTQRLAETVLPKYFKHRNFSSFVRQLNLCKLSFRRSVASL